MNYSILAAVPLLIGASVFGYNAFSQDAAVQPQDSLVAAYAEYQVATADMKASEKDLGEIWNQKIAADGLTLADLDKLLKKAEKFSKERLYDNNAQLERVNWSKVDANKNGTVSLQEFKNNISEYAVDPKTGQRKKMAQHIYERVRDGALNKFSTWDENRDEQLDQTEQAAFAEHERANLIKPTQVDSPEVQSFVNLMTALIEREPSGDKALTKDEFEVLMGELQK